MGLYKLWVTIQACHCKSLGEEVRIQASLCHFLEQEALNSFMPSFASDEKDRSVYCSSDGCARSRRRNEEYLLGYRTSTSSLRSMVAISAAIRSWFIISNPRGTIAWRPPEQPSIKIWEMNPYCSLIVALVASPTRLLAFLYIRSLSTVVRWPWAEDLPFLLPRNRDNHIVKPCRSEWILPRLPLIIALSPSSGNCSGLLDEQKAARDEH